MKNLQDLRIFVLTADTGSISAAARMLDLSSAVASASLKRLESELGALLLIRSTRSLRLTISDWRCA
jgi:DNA-binding transcriptional LysR family regulator